MSEPKMLVYKPLEWIPCTISKKGKHNFGITLILEKRFYKTYWDEIWLEKFYAFYLLFNSKSMSA